jgi:hypothetical protein
MKRWTPEALYDAKPWALVVIGGVLSLGTMLWSLWAGLWTGWRGLGCVAGAGLAIGGGVILQLRQDYRARSKWRRETRR